MGIVLEGDNGVKLRYPTSIVEASRTFDKSTYANWLVFFDEGIVSKSSRSMLAQAFLVAILCFEETNTLFVTC